MDSECNRKNPRDTRDSTNLFYESASARQIRLANLGGQHASSIGDRTTDKSDAELLHLFELERLACIDVVASVF